MASRITTTLLASQIATIMDQLKQLDRIGSFETKLELLASDMTHLRQAVDGIAGKIEGTNGMEKRVRLLEDDRVALRFISHPIFVGLTILLLGGLCTNVVTTWRDFSMMQDAVGKLVSHALIQDEQIRKSQDREAFFHGSPAP